eukprot:CAMPEP_0172309850 /NCGR_PEP_ID=MMETSP1058-20130122/10783_1 /TAXON_ID=83371 /ORGANISM="Detonula confervacea, Strain CCMP 353" /LENGTH=45 /DNA_ID= /DNA_START= /DNA_END= /DNA_ORIENTATION=
MNAANKSKDCESANLEMGSGDTNPVAATIDSAAINTAKIIDPPRL